MRHILLAAVLLAAVSTSTSAQRLGPTAKRPRLQSASDTNDARNYYALGSEKFERDPETAAAAFYWAARINPAWGEPMYARRAALLMNDQRMLRSMMEGNRRTLESNEMRRLDSLQFRALMMNPFLYRKLDRPMFVAYFRNAVTSGNRGEQTAELEYEIEKYLRNAGDGMRGWLAYSDGDFTSALMHYRRALSKAKDKTSIRLDLARIMSMQGQVDSATAEFGRALEEMRKKDQKDLVVFYNSKALAEYSIGVLLEGADSTNAAREAYGRALQEDLAYYPAHMRLGLLALGLKDTMTAMSELALASQIAPEEPHIRYVHGFALTAMGHYADAAVELKKAIELEPFYALPYLRLGQVYEQLDKGKEALDSYNGFLALAAATDPQRHIAVERASDIKEILGATRLSKP